MRWLIALVVMVGVARAGTRRVAIVVGSNAGNGDRPSLHYAQIDAGKFADVLRELGGVAPEDLFLLQGSSLAELQHALASAKQRIAAFRKTPGDRVVVLFYFSGHSDGEALELGRDRLSFGDLRRWLATAGADVRVALVDSCKSGALLAAKGGSLGPSFQIRLTDDVASSGEALLTSSAADEVALESREIGGSFFTHHFISGLRGAADTSGDGIVTLTEAYQYAYAHTIKTTGETVIGPQHPAYDYRLSGQGELVLAELTKPSATLALPTGFERILVSTHDQVVAEVPADARDTLSLLPGRYAVRAWRNGTIYAAQVVLTMNARSTLAAADLVATGSVSTSSKGGELPITPTTALIATGVTSGIAEGLGAMPGLRLEVATSSGFGLALSASSRGDAAFGPSFRETRSTLLVGYRRGISRGPLHLWLGLEAGGGFEAQTGLVMNGYSGVVAVGAFAGASYELNARLGVAFTPVFDVDVIRRDGKATIVQTPNAWLGLVVQL